MKAPSLFLLLIAGAVASMWAEEIQPYDALSRANVSLKADQVSGGSAVKDQTLKTTYGTYIKEVSSSKQIVITIPLPPKAADFTIEAYAFYRGRGTSSKDGMRAEKLEVTQDSPVSFTFAMSADHRRERWAYAEYGRVSEHGETISGWCARALAGGQVVGVAASAPQYEALAKSPGALADVLTAK